ncbi:uncharacterized protein FIESC28_00247 [Fusarium coffeatum]|uniref:Uncharacterized protein n=1 Tax=Fusarium coffeatum TaxID=231269 RepID=A0A366SCF5_9HYPO|nr:uncharacterized protein FIESC28_00247 [Fusarium coffeatum]RBR26979.1 hypothetical protein FIESC28_00247 [Fusarium coffeatum]
MEGPLRELMPLHEATRENDIILLNHLLKQPQIRTKLTRWFGEQCLKVAIADGYVEIVRALMTLPSSVFDFTDVHDAEGAASYLIRTAFFGQYAVFKVIAETGKVNLSGRDENGATPLHWASEAGSLSIVDYLLAGGHQP